MFSLIRNGFLEQHVYKKVVLLKILTNIVITVTLISVWQSIYKTNTLDLSMDYLISYTIMSSGLATIYATNIINKVSEQVKSGNIIFTVSKPKGLFYQLFFASVGSSLFKLIYIVIPSYIVLFSIYHSHVELVSIFSFVVILFLSYLLMYFFDLLFGLISIFSLNSWGLQSFKYALVTIFSGSIIPLRLYPSSLKSIVELLPFSKLYAVPIDAILLNNSLDFSVVIEYVVSISLCALFAIILEKIVTRKITINGG